MPEPGSYVGAVDIGGTKIEVGVVATDGSILSRRSLPTANVEPGTEGARRIAETLQRCQQDCRQPITAVGIGCTGPVDPLSGTIGKVALLPGWEGYHLCAELGSLLGHDVSMENDADAAALAESRWGRGRGVKRFVYVTVSTGIGTGFIVDGLLYRGVGGAHPEMGHQGIDPTGPPCYCGMRGCWESLASGTALETWFANESRLTRPLPAQAIFELAASGDVLAARAVERCANYLGRGLANLTTILVPEVIALGGGVMRSMAGHLPSLRQFIAQSCGEVPVTSTSLEIAALQHDAGLAGAAAVAILKLV